MTSVGRAERQIEHVEGFRVNMLHEDGRNLRSDKRNVPSYSFTHRADGDFTVRKWKELRFTPYYPGYRVNVLDRWGDVVPGNTKLATVRETY